MILTNSIDIGNLILNFFWNSIDLINSLYNFFSYELTLPGWLTDTLYNWFNFEISNISVFSLFTGSGAAILLIFSIYYILKSPV